MANRMYEIGQEQALLFTLQGDKKRKIFQLENEKEKLELDLTPLEGGWPGKNEGERSIARDRAFAASGSWIAYKLQLEEARAELISIEADIASAHAEQDSLKWLIRNETNVVMGGRDCLDEAALSAQDQEMEKKEEVDQVFQSEIEQPSEATEEAVESASVSEEQERDILMSMDTPSPDDLPF